MFLLDTSVISELRRTRPHGAVLTWLETVRPQKLYLSVVTLGEIQAGIERTRAHDLRKAEQIESWADAALDAFEILPVDVPIIRQWARLKRGRPDKNFEDTILAITAMVHRLTLATRNTKDFSGYSVQLINPFGYTA